MLHQGDVFEIDGVEFVVDFVNNCRAHCIPLTANKVTVFKDRFTDKEKVWAQRIPCNVSPNSDVKILRTLKGYDSKDRDIIAPPVTPKATPPKQRKVTRARRPK
jgi:hypothetical protein